MRIDDALPDDLDLPLSDLLQLISEFWPDDPLNSLFWVILDAYKAGLRVGLREANSGP
jgi:hypothetical protein